MNMEGTFYKAKWKQVGRRFEIWLADDREIKIVGSDFEKTAEILCEEICGRFGDGEAELDFDPLPPSRKASAGIDAESFILAGFKENIETDSDFNTLFTEPPCPLCRTPRGRRNERSLRLKGPPRGNWAAVRNSPTQVKICSEALMALLMGAGLPDDAWRPAEIMGKSRKACFELVDTGAIRL